ncbi:hypothetical protein CI610_02990 [invertebrate metagenome]|uniref:Uncharacterized protein n=1 Tax=invertebrate metagenome TaxID=1711999 RepID=A0A2H9T4E3_9ZZZZ
MSMCCYFFYVRKKFFCLILLLSSVSLSVNAVYPVFSDAIEKNAVAVNDKYFYIQLFQNVNEGLCYLGQEYVLLGAEARAVTQVYASMASMLKGFESADYFRNKYKKENQFFIEKMEDVLERLTTLGDIREAFIDDNSRVKIIDRAIYLQLPDPKLIRVASDDQEDSSSDNDETLVKSAANVKELKSTQQEAEDVCSFNSIESPFNWRLLQQQLIENKKCEGLPFCLMAESKIFLASEDRDEGFENDELIEVTACDDPPEYDDPPEIEQHSEKNESFRVAIKVDDESCQQMPVISEGEKPLAPHWVQQMPEISHDSIVYGHAINVFFPRDSDFSSEYKYIGSKILLDKMCGSDVYTSSDERVCITLKKGEEETLEVLFRCVPKTSETVGYDRLDSGLGSMDDAFDNLSEDHMAKVMQSVSHLISSLTPEQIIQTFEDNYCPGWSSDNRPISAKEILLCFNHSKEESSEDKAISEKECRKSQTPLVLCRLFSMDYDKPVPPFKTELKEEL